MNNSSFDLLKIIFQSDVSLVESYYSKPIEHLQNLLTLSPHNIQISYRDEPMGQRHFMITGRFARLQGLIQKFI